MRGFQPVGSIRPDQLGLPAKRARELTLALGWRQVAGDVMARQVTAVAVKRGVLEVQPSDRRWAETVRPLLPVLAGKLAATCPSLKIRKCRVLAIGEDVGESSAIPIVPAS
jgi:predicted nucleic acid-binding Zn ribbon protein